jgi:hypothetical protein
MALSAALARLPLEKAQVVYEAERLAEGRPLTL